MRYIDADALIKHLDDEIYECEELREQFQSTVHGTRMGLEMAKSYAKTLSTADVVEVVRCKDCKYSFVIDGKLECKCDTLYPAFTWVDSDDFCSYGERKEK